MLDTLARLALLVPGIPGVSIAIGYAAVNARIAPFWVPAESVGLLVSISIGWGLWVIAGSRWRRGITVFAAIAYLVAGGMVLPLSLTIGACMTDAAICVF